MPPTNNTAMELSRFKVTGAHRLYSFFSEEIMNSFCNGPIQELLLRGLGVLPHPQKKSELLIQQWIASQGHVFVQNMTTIVCIEVVTAKH